MKEETSKDMVVAVGVDAEGGEMDFDANKFGFGDMPEGEETEATVTIRKKGDGVACITAINGTPVEGESEESMDEGEFVDKYPDKAEEYLKKTAMENFSKKKGIL